MGTIGIVANPASGKDVRRLVARASVFDNQEKQAIVQRLLVGAGAIEQPHVLYMNDAHGIVRSALEEQKLSGEALESPETGTAFDTIAAARLMQERRVDVVVTLGGDGTNRAFALGWQNPPLIPMSTGTNNVFPNLCEATVAGAAAGLIAARLINVEAVARPCKSVHVRIDDERDDLALIDAVLSRERFVGARALLEPDALAMALLTRADPAAVGITSIGGLLAPLGDGEDSGLLLNLGKAADTRIKAPIAPGYYATVGVDNHRFVHFAEEIEVSGPGVLAFDGERERRLLDGQRAFMSVNRAGPRVIDTHKTLQLAAERGLFQR